MPANAADGAGRPVAPEQVRSVAPALERDTRERLLGEVWNRPAPDRAMDNGLTREQAAEVVTHLAFYAGWPNAMSARAVFKDVFSKRQTGKR